MKLDNEGGHDWWHIYRVWTMARRIGEKEQADMFVIELAALLHDIADPKFHNGDEDRGPGMAAQFLTEQEVDPDIIHHVIEIIKNISFKNSFGKVDFQSAELAVVQDADRLDAIGAIGIARAFNFGGYKSRPLCDPDQRGVHKIGRPHHQPFLRKTFAVERQDEYRHRKMHCRRASQLYARFSLPVLRRMGR